MKCLLPKMTPSNPPKSSFRVSFLVSKSRESFLTWIERGLSLLHFIQDWIALWCRCAFFFFFCHQHKCAFILTPFLWKVIKNWSPKNNSSNTSTFLVFLYFHWGKYIPPNWIMVVVRQVIIKCYYNTKLFTHLYYFDNNDHIRAT